MIDNYSLKEAIENYLQNIVMLSERKFPITSHTMSYFKDRVVRAFHTELREKELYIVVDELHNIVVKVINQE